MSKVHAYCPEHQIKLYYGYQTGECYEVYHAFEATDPAETADEDKMEIHLAELLETTPDDEDFDYGAMYIRLPEPVVNRIKAEGVQEHLNCQDNNK